MKDKEKQININRGAGARVDLLNKEIEELQKANAIVEMQNVVCKRLCNQDCRICNYYNKNDCIQKDNVDALYERGYQKLPEDSVVLSREEYNDLILAKKTFASDGEEVSSDTLLSTFKGIKEQARKETAEKIFNQIIWYAVKRIGQITNDSYYQISSERLQELSKQFGVEIKENKNV